MAYFIVYAKEATVYINYAASIIIMLTLIPRPLNNTKLQDYLALIAILTGALGDLTYFTLLFMILRSIFIVALLTVILASAITGTLNREVKPGRPGQWLAPVIYTVTSLVYTMASLEVLRPASPVAPILIEALVSPLFYVPMIAVIVRLYLT
ncbi:hypothetical protein [Vulcanisaeta thermophila]|uniref:hypothetical protein n=1 Tax=Vulcanisaeta thermophila TaxID=867917 RepID=UPI000852BAFE|nr:hypothetical protein [Vulcanisaeta thermophila]